MVGYLIAAPTLVAGARLLGPDEADAQVPTRSIQDVYDLSDFLTQAAAPTFALLTVELTEDGGARFELPRSENGQGLTTSFAMVIADELDLPVDRVDVTLSPAKVEWGFNQLTGASNSMHALYEPVRLAAAAARQRLVETAARELGLLPSQVRTSKGRLLARDGRELAYGDLARKAAVLRTTTVRPRLKRAAEQVVVGTSVGRLDARDIVTGRKRYAMDLEVEGAVCAMLHRSPTINATALAVENADEVRGMPGIEDVVLIPKGEFVPGGVAVTGRTFGQCIDGIRALRVRWSAGTVDGKGDADVKRDLEAAELPMAPQEAAGETIEETFTFFFRPGDPLETNTAVADARDDAITVWTASKTPTTVKEQLALQHGLTPDAVTVNVIEAGGSFGRRLFADAAYEAVAVSKAVGKPVRLQWHRTDSFRQGRVHPMAINRTKATISGGQVVAFDQRHTSVQTDYTHGLGEVFSAYGSKLPGANFAGFSQSLFYLTAANPYDVGLGQPALNEVYDYDTFNTSSTRNVYGPDMTTAREVVLEEVARKLGKDPMLFRLGLAKDARTKAVLERAAALSEWRARPLPDGIGRGVASHSEYKSRIAVVAEVDARPETVGRRVRDALTGPRVTKLFIAVDVGKAVNVLGVQAQIMGGAMDGIANALTYSLHLRDGHFLEGSWDNAFYTRQWNVPPVVEIDVLPDTTGEPGGVGELGVPAVMAAVALAWWDATGTKPTEFPILHSREDLGFVPQETVPPLPPQRSDGLQAGQF
jgi:isoquinoline 1-oxidoreductase subunit beta